MTLVGVGVLGLEERGGSLFLRSQACIIHIYSSSSFIHGQDRMTILCFSALVEECEIWTQALARMDLLREW